MPELVDTEYVDERCPTCYVDRLVIDRLDRVIARGEAESVAINHRCGHTMVYRSIGLWTEATPLSVAEIAQKSLPPPDPDAPVVRDLAEEHRRLMEASYMP